MFKTIRWELILKGLCSIVLSARFPQAVFRAALQMMASTSKGFASYSAESVTLIKETKFFFFLQRWEENNEKTKRNEKGKFWTALIRYTRPVLVDLFQLSKDMYIQSTFCVLPKCLSKSIDSFARITIVLALNCSFAGILDRFVWFVKSTMFHPLHLSVL